jgi:uncharacterized membrane protein (DUF373 family)
MEKFLTRFERYIVVALLGMMVLVVFLGTLELAVILIQQILGEPKWLLLDINEMLKIFGFFFMVLIGLELIETIKVYLKDEVVHAEITLLVAILAITRKVVILKVETLPPLTLIGIAAIIMALSAGYFLLKKALNDKS